MREGLHAEVPVNEATLTPVPGFAIVFWLLIALGYSAAVLQLVESRQTKRLWRFWYGCLLLLFAITVPWLVRAQVPIKDFVVPGSIYVILLAVPSLGAIYYAMRRSTRDPRSPFMVDLALTTLVLVGLVPVGLLVAVGFFSALAWLF